MSIWMSVSGSDVMALDGHEEAANYRAEGEAELMVDVAFSGAHDHVRLAVWDADMSLDVRALLSPDAARLLCDKLTRALEEV